MADHLQWLICSSKLPFFWCLVLLIENRRKQVYKEINNFEVNLSYISLGDLNLKVTGLEVIDFSS